VIPLRRIPRPLHRLGRVIPRKLRRRLVDTAPPPEPWELTLANQPPRCLPGMETAAPDFVGLGVQRAGTTWWWNLLTQHPKVFRRPDQDKEIRFLMARFAWDPPTPESAAEYAAWFPRPPGYLTGEWTPRYLSHPWIGAALSVLAPDAKFLVSLRDPVERYVSGMTHSLLRGGRMKPGYDSLESYFSGYARLLGMLESSVPRDRLLVLQYERCVLEPEAQLNRTFEHLGLDSYTPDDVRARVNVTPDRLELSPERRNQLVAAFSAEVDDLIRRYPEIDRELWPNFA
jgi:hypothetical protein